MSDQTPNVNNPENGGVPQQPPLTPPPGQAFPPQGQPAQPMGQQPGQPYQQPGQPMGQPYQQPGQPYQQPGQPYQQPGQQNPGQPGWQQAPQDPNAVAKAVENVNLNYWLSVFFAWLPALIFYFSDKGKNQLVDQYNTENLNFSLLRTGAAFVGIFLSFIPYIGWLLALAINLGGLILHLLVAMKVKENFAKGAAPGFMFNFPLVK